MNGVLIVDKPEGLSSHEVVVIARRALGEKRIGHTGTLDPLATGVLPLACGLATRLVRFLSSSDKDYDATIRFGLATDTYDITGEEVRRSNLVPGREAIERALHSLTGEYGQVPPIFSAKKIGGDRAYKLARRHQVVELKPVTVRVTRAELLEVSGPDARVAVTCSAGFYVRSFAHALGELTGAGACLAGLRRTRSGDFTLDQALTVEILTEGPAAAAAFLVPLEQLLPAFPWVEVTDEGLSRVSHGRQVTPGEIAMGGSGGWGGKDESDEWDGKGGWVRVLDEAGHLVAVATPGSDPGSLHPSIVLR